MLLMKLLIIRFFLLQTSYHKLRFRKQGLYLFAWSLLISGCAEHYREGLKLEKEQRFEEASVAYQHAVARKPRNSRFKESLVRVNQKAAPENFKAYLRYLTQEKLHKAYARLEYTLLQKPDLVEARQELNKWTKILIAGQIDIELTKNFRKSLNNSDTVQLIVKINTPIPGRTIEAILSPSTGIFFVEDLLYKIPPEQLSLYSLNSVVVYLTQTPLNNVFYSTPSNEQKSLSSKAANTISLKLADYGAPTVADLSGKFGTVDKQFPSIIQHRQAIKDANTKFSTYQPTANSSYSLILSSNSARPVNTKYSDFLPRFLYIGGDQRMAVVDFGRYQAKQNAGQYRYHWVRLSLKKADYFALLAGNLVLQLYFQHKVRVISYGLAR